jgi:hypothetical protein
MNVYLRSSVSCFPVSLLEGTWSDGKIERMKEGKIKKKGDRSGE